MRRVAEAIATRRARQGWRLYATNLPAERMDLGACVRSYRGGWCLERDFHLLKDAPLGIRPRFERRDDQLVGRDAGGRGEVGGDGDRDGAPAGDGLRAQVVHEERYGPMGVTYLVGTALGAG